MKEEYFQKRLWNIGYTIGQIEEATSIQDYIESELHNVMCVERNPSDEELREALYQYQIYCPRRLLRP